LQLREKDIGDIREVDYAILEPTGKLSVFKKDANNANRSSLTFPLILDGVVQEDNLNHYNKDKVWLLQQLKINGYTSVEQVSYCSLLDDKIFIDNKVQ